MLCGLASFSVVCSNLVCYFCVVVGCGVDRCGMVRCGADWVCLVRTYVYAYVCAFMRAALHM